MNSRQVECFLKVCHSKNFTEAAAELYLSQPAISKLISSLESELGVTLLRRDRRSVEITPAGKEMYEFFLRLQGEFEHARHEALRLEHESKGSLRLGYADRLPIDAIARSILQFTNQYKEVRFCVESAWHMQLRKGLENGNYDLIVTLEVNVINRPDFEYINLFSSQCYFVYSKDLPFANNPNISIKDFLDVDFYVPDPEELPYAKDNIELICSQWGAYQKEIHFVPNASTMLLMAESGKGATILDELVLETTRMTSLRKLPVDKEHKIVVAWKHKNANPLITKYLDILQSVMQKD